MSLRFIKHNPVSRALLESALRFRCRSTRAFVFVANPGRSGSKTLSDMLTGIPGIAAFHEPTPNMTFEPDQGVDQDARLRRLFYEKKIFYILRAAAGCTHYVETNHLFIKTFADYAIDYFGERVHVIHLRRDVISVALSFHRLGDIPGVATLALRYMLHPADPRNLVDAGMILRPDPGFEHPFFRSLWYWYEIEARIERARARYPGVRWHSFSTGQLNDQGAVRSLCRELGIAAHVEEIVARVGLKSNLRTTQKEVATAQVGDVTREQAVEMNARLLAAMTRRPER